MLKAKDIMTIDVFAVNKDTPVAEAIDVMLTNEVAGLPVVDDQMRLVGMLTEKDVLSLHVAPEEGQQKKVKDFMTSPAVFFDEDAALSRVCYCLQHRVFRRVPVTSDRRVVGVISRPDVLKHVLKQMRQAQSKSPEAQPSKSCAAETAADRSNAATPIQKVARWTDTD
ncbi:MAG: CBS domain-containing protein [Planctomycetota bacterium]|jgi:CBS domain-containing protein